MLCCSTAAGALLMGVQQRTNLCRTVQQSDSSGSRRRRTRNNGAALPFPSFPLDSNLDCTCAFAEKGELFAGKGEFFEDDANLGMRLQEGMMTLICGHLEIGES
jgi:hypothetical protein